MKMLRLRPQAWEAIVTLSFNRKLANSVADHIPLFARGKVGHDLTSPVKIKFRLSWLPKMKNVAKESPAIGQRNSNDRYCGWFFYLLSAIRLRG
jgi:hypothetical protein